MKLNRLQSLLAAVAIGLSSPAIAEEPAIAHGAVGWWTRFDNPELDGLVDRAMARSADVATGQALLKAAQARAGQARAPLLPYAGLYASENTLRGPLINAAGGEGRLINASLDASLDIDLSGGAWRNARAGRLDAQAQAQVLQAIRLDVQAYVASAYARTCALAGQERLALGLVEDRAKAVRLQQGLVSEGLAAPLDMAASEEAARDAEHDLAQVRRDRLAAQGELAQLIDARPDALPVLTCARLDTAWRAPAGLPSDILRRRPDVRAAQQRLEAAELRLKAARTAWFPQLSLTASTGFASQDLSTLFSASAESLALGLLMNLPVLDGGRRKAGRTAAEAELDLAQADYRATVLRALWETHQGLRGLEAAHRRAAQAVDAETLARRRSVLASGRVEAGLAPAAAVLTAHAAYAQAQSERIEADAQAAIAMAAVLQSLGGDVPA